MKGVRNWRKSYILWRGVGGYAIIVRVGNWRLVHIIEHKATRIHRSKVMLVWTKTLARKHDTDFVAYTFFLDKKHIDCLQLGLFLIFKLSHSQMFLDVSQVNWKYIKKSTYRLDILSYNLFILSFDLLKWSSYIEQVRGVGNY